MMHPTVGRTRNLALGLVIAACVTTAVGADDESTVTELMRSGRSAAAMSAANRHLAKNPGNPRMRFLKALIQQETGRQASAVTTYRKLIDDYPTLAEPYNNLAVLYSAMGAPEKARATWELAASASRSLANKHEKLGDVYADLAMRTYRHALRSDEPTEEAVAQPPVIRQLIPGAGNATAAPASAVRRTR